MRRVSTLCSNLAIALAALVLSGCGGCGGERQDLGGKATLRITGDGEGITYSLYVGVNGETPGMVGKLKDGQAEEFTFDNARNGKNKLVVMTTWLGSSESKTFPFTALPGSVTVAHLKIGSFGKPIEATISTEIAGVDPAQVAEARARQDKAEAEERARKAKAEADLESEYQKFAKEFVPDLQRAIDRYEEQIKQFTEQRAAFAREMAKLKKDPEQRPAYVRQKEIIDKMAEDVKKLRADREETYIRWKELSLLRDTAETQGQRDKLLQDARKAANSADETFDKYMKQSEEAGAK